MYGTVKWYNDRKGYGFIIPDDGSGDVFFHINAFPEGAYAPDEGERVEYQTRMDRKTGKIEAKPVRVIEEESDGKISVYRCAYAALSSDAPISRKERDALLNHLPSPDKVGK